MKNNDNFLTDIDFEKESIQNELGEKIAELRKITHVKRKLEREIKFLRSELMYYTNLPDDVENLEEEESTQ